MFLLYGTSAMYTLLYMCWALWNTYRDPTRTRPLFKAFFDFSNQRTVAAMQRWVCLSSQRAQYFKLGLCIFINGLLSQMSDYHVNGNVQSCLYQARCRI